MVVDRDRRQMSVPDPDSQSLDQRNPAFPRPGDRRSLERDHLSRYLAASFEFEGELIGWAADG